MTTIPLQKSVALDATNQVSGIQFGQRRDAEAYVSQNLDVNAAEPEANQGSEGGILHHAGHDFDAAGHHRLHQHSFHCLKIPVLRESRRDLVIGNAYLSPSGEIQMHAADFGFMDKGMGHQLDGDRKPDMRCNGAGLCCRRRYASLRQRDRHRAQDRTRFGGRQPAVSSLW